MPPKRKKKMVLRSEAQRDALASPVRLELLEHFDAVAPASVRELADRMGRSPHAVHYHIRLLVAAGLVVRVGERRSGRKDEAVYDLAAERFEVACDTLGQGQEGFTAKAVRAILRRAERDFVALAEDEPERLQMADVLTSRARARLSAGARDDVMKHLRAIQRIFDSEIRREPLPQAKLKTYSLTVLFLPEAGEGGNT